MSWVIYLFVYVWLIFIIVFVLSRVVCGYHWWKEEQGLCLVQLDRRELRCGHFIFNFLAIFPRCGDI